MALKWIVAGEGVKGEFGIAADMLKDELGEFKYSEFSGVADIDRTGDAFCVHETDKAFDKVVDVAEGASLGAVAIDGDILAFKGLNNEVGNDASVIGKHAGAVGVENADYADVDVVLAVVVKEEGFGATLALIVAGTDTDGINAALVGLRLRVHIWIPVDFRGRGLEDAGFDSLGQAEAVDGTHYGSLGRLNGIELVVWR